MVVICEKYFGFPDPNNKASTIFRNVVKDLSKDLEM